MFPIKIKDYESLKQLYKQLKEDWCEDCGQWTIQIMHGFEGRFYCIKHHYREEI